jgi:hypothetical protein
MAVRKLPKKEWQEYCRRVARSVIGKRAEIEVASLKLGSQVEAAWLPLLGIAYDPKNDIIEIAVENVDHLVDKPKEFYVDEGSGGLESLEIVDGDGIQRIVKLRDPLMLPPPAKVS